MTGRTRRTDPALIDFATARRMFPRGTSSAALEQALKPVLVKAHAGLYSTGVDRYPAAAVRDLAHRVADGTAAVPPVSAARRALYGGRTALGVLLGIAVLGGFLGVVVYAIVWLAMGAPAR
ncbi:hypothetical protein GCM10010218_41080 [Streptomyces mashuensis]|uniref:Uncharacterized protein n=1 Tax=Streptomyces mashuensis TaxID=33904 RepID=A0A919B6E9_9ACTN|nr:hypothetical protein [Streptomyces mashuensis]GHF55367.1 hypothetical protein GCM10010218_41080 [Streptomyces mashuensis]